MNITLRLLLGYFLIVGLAAWFVLNSFSQEVKPGVRQTMEETLVDTAHLLAEMATEDTESGKLDTKRFAAAFKRYQAREPHASIWGFKKNSLDLRVYITDARGIVVYDSEDEAVGQDYSKWNDVYLTLQGQYGVRSSQLDPGDNRTNLYLLGLAFSSAGKEHPRRVNTRLLWEVGLGHCVGDKFASG